MQVQCPGEDMAAFPKPAHLGHPATSCPKGERLLVILSRRSPALPRPRPLYHIPPIAPQHQQTLSAQSGIYEASLLCVSQPPILTS